MRLRATVSLESDLQPVRTHRVELDVANARLGARRALEAAMKAYPKVVWRSVCIVLEKLDEKEDTAAA